MFDVKRMHSQNYEEDKILDEILNKINCLNKTSIELMAGNCVENNTSKLLSSNWNCLMIDGNDDLINYGKEFYKSYFNKPIMINKWITKENICKTLQEYFTFAFEYDKIDVFSLDMDGMDFWILKSLYDNNFSPKIIICEIQEMWKHDKCLTLKYNASFSTKRVTETGCSLKAFQTLLDKYKLIDCISTGYNVFFLRKDLDIDDKLFPPLDPRKCFQHHTGQFEKIINKRLYNVKSGNGVGEWINPTFP